MAEQSFREVTLPSGAILKIAPAPFADAKNLYQALLRELKSIPITAETSVAQWTWFADLYKNIYASAFSSPEVEKHMWACAARCLYDDGTLPNNVDGLKVEPSLFEKTVNRQDFETVCVEVVKENVDPFAKSLYAKYASLLQETKPATQE